MTISSGKPRIMPMIYLIVWFAIAIPPLVSGYHYYTTPVQERPYRKDNDLFKPSGEIGHGLGVVGSLFMIIGVATYSIRKRFESLHRFGKLRAWLSFHIFLCTLGPFLVVLHTSFRLTGLVAISFWSMIIVVASGVIGRYVYVRIPKTAEGHFLSIAQLERKRDHLTYRLEKELGIEEQVITKSGILIQNTSARGIFSSFALALKFDLGRLYWHRQWKELASQNSLTDSQMEKGKALAKQLIRNDQQKAVLQPFHRIFTYWHIFHVPLAILMFLILFIHIIVAVMFGYTWIF